MLGFGERKYDNYVSEHRGHMFRKKGVRPFEKHRQEVEGTNLRSPNYPIFAHRIPTFTDLRQNGDNMVQRAIFQAKRETTGTYKPADTWQATFSVLHRYCACASIPTRSNLDTAVPKNKGRMIVFIDCLPASWPSCDADSAGAL